MQMFYTTIIDYGQTIFDAKTLRYLQEIQVIFEWLACRSQDKSKHWIRKNKEEKTHTIPPERRNRK